jgi:two-component system alkaline phosphatase synthesis response regulator PhoP
MAEQKIILLVDDEASFREIISTQLGTLGFKVVTASNGEQAITQAEKVQPDLILMDIHLGEKETGTDVALTLKQNQKTRNLRIAFLTSLKEPWPGVAGENQKVAKEIGMEDYLEKTQDPQIIGEQVKAILERASPVAETEPTPAPSPLPQ